MSEYTPTTEDVRFHYEGEHVPESRAEEFDRWLASDRADVWDESMRAMAEAWGWAPSTYSGPNPYRDEADA